MWYISLKEFTFYIVMCLVIVLPSKWSEFAQAEQERLDAEYIANYVEPTLGELALERCGQYDLNYTVAPNGFWNCTTR